MPSTSSDGIDLEPLLALSRKEGPQSVLLLLVKDDEAPESEGQSQLDRFVQRHLFPALVPEDIALIRELSRHETARRRRRGGCSDAHYLLTFMLYMTGEARDVFLVHDALHANVDCEATLEHDLLQMRRSRQELLAYLNQVYAQEKWRRERYAGLDEEVCNAFDLPSYESATQFERAVGAYYGELW